MKIIVGIVANVRYVQNLVADIIDVYFNVSKNINKLQYQSINTTGI